MLTKQQVQQLTHSVLRQLLYLHHATTCRHMRTGGDSHYLQGVQQAQLGAGGCALRPRRFRACARQ